MNPYKYFLVPVFNETVKVIVASALPSCKNASAKNRDGLRRGWRSCSRRGVYDDHRFGKSTTALGNPRNPAAACPVPVKLMIGKIDGDRLSLSLYLWKVLRDDGKYRRNISGTRAASSRQGDFVYKEHVLFFIIENERRHWPRSVIPFL